MGGVGTPPPDRLQLLVAEGDKTGTLVGREEVPMSAGEQVLATRVGKVAVRPTVEVYTHTG